MENVGNKLMEKLLEYAQNIEVFTKSEVLVYLGITIHFKTKTVIYAIPN